MKKIFCAVLMMFVMCSVSFGASEDMSVYVRQDVFDAKMETLFLRLHSEIENLGTRLEGKIDALSERIDGLDKKIDGVEKSLSERINGLEKRMDARFEGVEKRMDVMDKRIDEGFNGINKRIDEGFNGINKRMDEGFSGVNKRIDDTHTFVYWLLVIFGAILIMPFINKFWDFHKEHRTPAVTLEDVKRLITEAIAENNAKIRA